MKQNIQKISRVKTLLHDTTSDLKICAATDGWPCIITTVASLQWGQIVWHTEAFYSCKHTNAKSMSKHTHQTLKASLTCIVGQSFVVCVKQEPSLLPCLDPPSSFREKASTPSRCKPQVRAVGNPVTQWLYMGPKVKVWSKEKGQAALLERQVELSYPVNSAFSMENTTSIQWHF